MIPFHVEVTVFFFFRVRVHANVADVGAEPVPAQRARAQYKVASFLRNVAGVLQRRCSLARIRLPCGLRRSIARCGRMASQSTL